MAVNLAALPAFSGRPQAEGLVVLARPWLVTARERFFDRWSSEWFTLRYAAATDSVLCLRRIGYDWHLDEIVIMTPAALNAATLASGFVPTTLNALTRLGA